MLKELQEQFMKEAAAAEDDPDDDLLRLFLLRRDDVIELAKKAFKAKNQGVLPDPLPVCQVIMFDTDGHGASRKLDAQQSNPLTVDTD